MSSEPVTPTDRLRLMVVDEILATDAGATAAVVLAPYRQEVEARMRRNFLNRYLPPTVHTITNADQWRAYHGDYPPPPAYLTEAPAPCIYEPEPEGAEET